MMSRTRLTEDANALLTDCPVELGPSLKLLGDILQKISHDRIVEREGLDAVFLNAQERGGRGNEPLAFAHDVDIRIETHGKVLRISRDNPDRPGVTIPVGQSDKMTTATMPHTWIEGILVQALISAFDGDDTHARSVIAKMGEWIDKASIQTDDGRLKIDQERLPQAKNAVEVAEMLSSLKRTFKSKSRGTTKLNLTLSVDDAATMTTHLATTNVLDDLIAIPAVGDAHASHATTIHATTRTTGDGTLSVAPSPTHEINDAIIDAIGTEARTIGYIRKAMIDYDEADWKPRLEALVKRGQVSKEGRARACRYSQISEVRVSA